MNNELNIQNQLQSEKLMLLERPSQSPDLNPLAAPDDFFLCCWRSVALHPSAFMNIEK